MWKDRQEEDCYICETIGSILLRIVSYPLQIKYRLCLVHSRLEVLGGQTGGLMLPGGVSERFTNIFTVSQLARPGIQVYSLFFLLLQTVSWMSVMLGGSQQYYIEIAERSCSIRRGLRIESKDCLHLRSRRKRKKSGNWRSTERVIQVGNYSESTLGWKPKKELEEEWYSIPNTEKVEEFVTQGTGLANDHLI